MDKAREALLSADSEQKEKRWTFAVNRGYYACFYALSAVLLKQDLSFKRHSGVRAALHTRLISTGIIDEKYGKYYDLLFESRQRGDYQWLVEFSEREASELIEYAKEFVKEMERLISQDG